MAAGHRVYSFDWQAFSDLTTNPKSETPEALVDEQLCKKLEISGSLPKDRGELSSLIRDLFVKPEWYADQSADDAKLRYQLLYGMFFEKKLESVGLAAKPAWREFYECCSFDMCAALAGRIAFDLKKMKRGKKVYFDVIKNAQPGDNEFWWFGGRPYRYGGWEGSFEQAMTFPGKFGHAVYSIHSPEQVNSLATRLAELKKACAEINHEALEEMFANYGYCINSVQKKNAGMLILNDT